MGQRHQPPADTLCAAAAQGEAHAGRQCPAGGPSPRGARPPSEMPSQAAAPAEVPSGGALSGVDYGRKCSWMSSCHR